MPYIKNAFDLQMYAIVDAGGSESAAGGDSAIGDAATTGAENPAGDGVATGSEGEQAAPAAGDQTGEESWDSLIKGRYKKEYDAAVKSAINRRFKNQQDQSAQIKAIDPIVKALAQKYKIQANPDGSIPIDQLSNAVLYDNEALEQEAYNRGMSVDTLKQIKQLEQENASLRGHDEMARQQEEWNQLNQESEAMKEFYPEFDLTAEMENPEFMSLLATLRNSGFPNSVRRAYEVIHHDDLMTGSMQYATQQAKRMVTNAVKAGQSRPTESAAGSTAAGGMQGIDPSKLTDEQMEDIISRAKRGERITFS